MAFRVKRAEQVGAVVVIDRSPQSIQLSEERVLVSIQVFAVLDVMPEEVIVLESGVGAV